MFHNVTAVIAKRETPGHIPNPEAKPFSADGTALGRVWESRTPPDFFNRRVLDLMNVVFLEAPDRWLGT